MFVSVNILKMNHILFELVHNFPRICFLLSQLFVKGRLEAATLVVSPLQRLLFRSSKRYHEKITFSNHYLNNSGRDPYDRQDETNAFIFLLLVLKKRMS